MDKKEKRLPSLEGLKNAKDELKKNYRKQPTDTIMEILSEPDEKNSENKKKDEIAAKENSGHDSEVNP